MLTDALYWKRPRNWFTRQIYLYRDGWTTTFSGADSLGRTLTYTDSEYTDVYLNGVKLDKADYTATSGTSIVLDSGASAGDILEILAFDTFGLFSGEFAQDVTVAGDLTVSGTTTTAATTMTGDLSLADKIVHTGDTNAIRFPAADTVTIETAASERMRVLSMAKLQSAVQQQRPRSMSWATATALRPSH